MPVPLPSPADLNRLFFQRVDLATGQRRMALDDPPILDEDGAAAVLLSIMTFFRPDRNPSAGCSGPPRLLLADPLGGGVVDGHLMPQFSVSTSPAAQPYWVEKQEKLSPGGVFAAGTVF